jgi:cell division protein FtsB
MSAQPSRLREGARPRRAGLHLVKRNRRRLIKRGKGARFVSVALVGAILVGAVIFGVLLEQVVLAQSAFKLSRINEQLASAQTKHEELLLNAAKLEAPGRIEHYARTRLGMVDPPIVEYIVADVPRHMNRRLAASTRAPGLGTAEQTAAGAPVEEGAP